MSKKKSGSHGAGHVDESWLIPYADLLTLLLALFIVLFASSSVDKEKYEQMAQAFAGEFMGTTTSAPGDGSAEGPNIIIPPGLIFPRPSNEPDATPSEESGGLTEAEMQMLGMFNSISNYIDSNALSEEMSLRLNGQFLLLTLTSDVWFASGSADITLGQRDIAHKLADLIAANLNPELPLNIIITGHTDNVPIRTSHYKSNWYLSASRAINFMEAMLEDSQLDPRMFSARGYGEYEPVDTNDTDDGRQRNRRVEVLMSFNSELKESLLDAVGERSNDAIADAENPAQNEAPDQAANPDPELDGEYSVDFTQPGQNAEAQQNAAPDPNADH